MRGDSAGAPISEHGAHCKSWTARARCAADMDDRDVDWHFIEQMYTEAGHGLLQGLAKRQRRVERNIQSARNRDPAEEYAFGEGNGGQEGRLMMTIADIVGIDLDMQPVAVEHGFGFVDARCGAAVEGLLDETMQAL
ncbi:hypothetical protein [Bradyrhizobium quebecense]|uniref:Uncharacterized protein n=1 Tax=Bradyrhizobium quebecense TaxID=2748629 RepID=A0ACD3VMD5_9BRAD|nr:hypothetical protein [Bradyrhizobium quebecense]UGY07448.1 hypothetical protein J4P68_0040455 [Bradyrhizobium quebecense]